MDLHMTIKDGGSLADGDYIVNVGKVMGEADVDGVFCTYMIEGGEWELRTGTYVRKSFPLTFHVGDSVTVRKD